MLDSNSSTWTSYSKKVQAPPASCFNWVLSLGTERWQLCSWNVSIITAYTKLGLLDRGHVTCILHILQKIVSTNVSVKKLSIYSTKCPTGDQTCWHFWSDIAKRTKFWYNYDNYCMFGNTVWGSGGLCRLAVCVHGVESENLSFLCFHVSHC